MKLRQLEIFVAVARARNMTRAAETLFIEQPAVTRQLQGLEEELGIKLFEKSRSGLDLTPAGERLLQRAISLLDQVDRIHGDIAAIAEEPTGPLCVGTIPSLGNLVLSEAAQRFAKSFPKVSLRLVQEISDDLQTSIVNDRVDIGVISEPVSRTGIDVAPFLEEPLCIFGPVRAAKRLDDPMALLRTGRFVLPSRAYAIRRAIEHYCAQSGIAMASTIEADAIPLVKRMVQAGTGFGISPYSAVYHEVREKKLAAVPLKGLRTKRLIAARTGRQLSLAAQEMRRCLIETVESLAAADTAFKR